MDTIRKKINALKEDNEIKQDEIERLQAIFSRNKDDNLHLRILCQLYFLKK